MKEKYQLIFSVYHHEVLGYLLSSHLVMLNQYGHFTLTHKKVFLHNLADYQADITEDQREIVRLLDEMEPQKLILKLTKRNVKPVEFFTNKRLFTPDVAKAFSDAIEKRTQKVMDLLVGKSIWVMGRDGYPASRQIHVCASKASVKFHFKRNEEGTRYYPTILLDGELVRFMKREAFILVNHPCWFAVEDRIFTFKDDLDGAKIRPFLQKYYIHIPPQTEPTYFRGFVLQLVQRYRVVGEGGIRIEEHRPEGFSKLKITENFHGEKRLALFFTYAGNEFQSNNAQFSKVELIEESGNYLFKKRSRDRDWEEEQMQLLESLGLKNDSGALYYPADPGVDFSSWLTDNVEQLREAGFFTELVSNGKEYYFGKAELSLSVAETNDWFDIKAVVRIGDFLIPFNKLRTYILRREREFRLPNGHYAILPEAWFAQLNDLFVVTGPLQEDAGDGIKLRKFHFGLVNELVSGEGIEIEGTSSGPIPIETVDQPAALQATLRPYQQGGLEWLVFLKRNGFGGVLADDMGLGKTIQTISFMLWMREHGFSGPILLAVPTSLIFNWVSEIQRFAPNLSSYVHTGQSRSRSTTPMLNCDVTITTYGLIRNDLDLFKSIAFEAVVLDEAQSIKNPETAVSKAVIQLNGKTNLALTGTPLENSILDLWSIMNFANHGLLGTQTAFERKYQALLDRIPDEAKAESLRKTINPFILRRTKQQVATELPDKIETVVYCSMTEEQEKVYEEVKSGFRNELMENIESSGLKASAFLLLRGLTLLRQLANHPKMVEADYAASSGKFEEVFTMLENTLASGARVLIFSQFVKHLNIIKAELEGRAIKYCYLDGQTPQQERARQVQQFNEPNAEEQVFLLSLKAGGLGLNLTSAEYVILLDPWWNPAIERQAVDRSHRIGQTKTVFSYKFITKGTIEEKILKLQESKKQLSDQLITVDESMVKSLTLEDIQDLFA